MILQAIPDFNMCKSILFKNNVKMKSVEANFFIEKGLNTSLIQSENSTRTILVSDNRIARPDEDNLKLNYQ